MNIERLSRLREEVTNAEKVGLPRLPLLVLSTFKHEAEELRRSRTCSNATTRLAGAVLGLTLDQGHRLFYGVGCPKPFSQIDKPEILKALTSAIETQTIQWS